MSPLSGSALSPATHRLLFTVAALLLLVLGAAAVRAGNRSGPVPSEPLTPPEPISAALASRLTAAALSLPGIAGARPDRLVVLPPSRWWESGGPCEPKAEARCALMAIYDYTAGLGMHVLLTLDDHPAVIRVRAGPDLPVPLSAREKEFGFTIAERALAVRRLLDRGYHRALTHDFAPGPASDPCRRHRCVIVDYWRGNAGDLQPFLIDLTAGRLLAATDPP